MWTRINKHRLIAAVALLSLAFAAGGRVRAAEDALPAQLSDEAFWHLVTDFSEAGGFFRFDNFISNEALFQHVVGRLKETTKPGGVYLAARGRTAETAQNLVLSRLESMSIFNIGCSATGC